MNEIAFRFFIACTLLVPLSLSLLGSYITIRHPHQEKVSWGLGIATAVSSGFLLLISIVILVLRQDMPPVFSVGTSLFRLHIDALSLYFILLVNAIAFAVTWNAVPYLEGKTAVSLIQRPAFFHTSVNFFHFTMLLVPMVDNLISLWIAIELTTLASAFLVGYQNDRNAWEAAWKYLVITSTGIILALLGTIFLANAIPEANLSQPNVLNWTNIMRLASQNSLDPRFIELSFLFALLGYGTKAGLAPTHTWLPDGHGEAPAPISALLSGVLLKSALYAILRFYTITNTVLHDDTRFTSTALLGLGLLSLILATPFILKENRFKRILAYHSLEHMGIITFGIGIGGPIALFGALLHTLNHAITKALMFLSYGNVMRQYNRKAPSQQAFDPDQITGIFRTMPITGAVMAIGGLALVGMPPFNIFMSEFIILWGSISQLGGDDKGTILSAPIIIAAVVLFLLSTTLIFYGLVRHLSKLVLHKMSEEYQMEEKLFRDLAPLLFLTIFVVLFGVWIAPALSHLISESVAIVLHTEVSP